jgi:hypothetical protein
MNKNITPDMIHYIETPKVKHTPEKIDAILEKRMREFMLARRQRKWLLLGE